LQFTHWDGSANQHQENHMFVTLAATRRMLGAAAVIGVAIAPGRLAAQTAGEHIALGDKSHAALDAPGALRHFEEAVRIDPRSYEALWKATREAVDAGEFNADDRERDRLYSQAELYARRAVEANPGDAQGHFHLARALGRKALSVSKRDQVKYATDIRRHALEALEHDPKHSGALHVMGVWNYNVMRLSGVTRFMAKKFLGGAVFDSASWEEAQRYMEESVANDPRGLVHHLDLARVYRARNNKPKAREHYEAIIRGTPAELNDRKFQAEAAEEVKSVR
jgi:tetratricopeptide (TPR) repeat protein